MEGALTGAVNCNPVEVTDLLELLQLKTRRLQEKMNAMPINRARLTT
jgi:hypothetical protein